MKESHLGYSSILAIAYDRLSIEDLVEVVKYFIHCDTDAPWRWFGSPRDSTEPENGCGLEFRELYLTSTDDEGEQVDRCPFLPLADPSATCRWYCDQLELGFVNARLNRRFTVFAKCCAGSEADSVEIESVRFRFHRE